MDTDQAIHDPKVIKTPQYLPWLESNSWWSTCYECFMWIRWTKNAAKQSEKKGMDGSAKTIGSLPSVGFCGFVSWMEMACCTVSKLRLLVRTLVGKNIQESETAIPPASFPSAHQSSGISARRTFRSHFLSHFLFFLCHVRIGHKESNSAIKKLQSHVPAHALTNIGSNWMTHAHTAVNQLHSSGVKARIPADFMNDSSAEWSRSVSCPTTAITKLSALRWPEIKSSNKRSSAKCLVHSWFTTATIYH